MLRNARDAVEPRLRGAVEQLGDPLRTVVGYHFGWCDPDGTAVVYDGGKAVRPALVLLMSRAVGGVPDDAVDAAAAMELVHNFSLIHDDVIDGDTSRRHRSTVWSLFGVPLAILAGDGMLALAGEVMASSAHPAAGNGSAELYRMTQRMIAGQLADIDFESRADVGLVECRLMAAAKTGALLECSCVLGAMFGGGDPSVFPAVRGFGSNLGMAFQLVDDLLGIWGDPLVTGKPVWSDLRARKKSLPVVAALSSPSPAGRRLATAYLKEGTQSDDDLAMMADLVVEAGGREWTEQAAQRHFDEALVCLRAIAPPAEAERDLVAIADLIVHRNR
ncbi:polyprenyl synthetase family protein [Umezawaea endophytica]|uniref:polyprenyl synthetase family protein n=1 Tax=Umezawaea endophytica TaxID=1654476 RepID=UPI0036D8B616